VPNTRQQGRRWEQAAEALLLRRGLQTLARNFLCRTGELDLVMLDGPVLVFRQLWEQLGLTSILTNLQTNTEVQFSIDEAVFARNVETGGTVASARRRARWSQLNPVLGLEIEHPYVVFAPSRCEPAENRNAVVRDVVLVDGVPATVRFGRRQKLRPRVGGQVERPYVVALSGVLSA